MTFHSYANAVMHKYSPLNTFSSLQHFFKAHKVFGSMTLRDLSTIRHPKKQLLKWMGEGVGDEVTLSSG